MCPSVLKDAKEGSQQRSLKTPPTELKNGTYPATAPERAEMQKTHLPWPHIMFPLVCGQSCHLPATALQTELHLSPSAKALILIFNSGFSQHHFQYFSYGFRIPAVEPLPQQQFLLFLPCKNWQWIHLPSTCQAQLSAHSAKILPCICVFIPATHRTQESQ